VFENKVLRIIIGRRRKEIESYWRKLHNQHLFSLQNIIRVIESRRVRWMVQVACIEWMGNITKILVRTSEGKRPLRRPERRGKKILK
jgi:hypothetical protein